MTYDLNQLYQRAFGRFIVYPGLTKPGKLVESYTPAALLGKGKKQSLLSTPIMMPLKLDDYAFPLEPLIEVSTSKSIVINQMVNAETNVLEDMGLDNFKLTIRGFLVSEQAGSAPLDELRKLMKLIRKRSSLKVNNELLGAFGIRELAILSARFGDPEGGIEFKPYTLECISDEAVELRLNQDKADAFTDTSPLPENSR
ncbi:DUF6046 domain-containing protein [Microscilla marina]|uniref:DUF6046 domain-containing protein n=1 Tax=Microscilla marina ATCC 23134 TaxID=313606 RepID=A1ZMG6_MICM2|nr:DUF6046 domain-containing protein [Microscilla marina]EAY28346.1 hypothetical protein M23134_03898 [Microscilla marina ATCC 23134]